MNSPIVRMAVAAVILLLLFVGAWYTVIKGGVYREIRHSGASISTIPMEINGWKGDDVDLDEKLFEAIDAKKVVSRNYTNPLTGREISLHCAEFVQFWKWLPHKPLRCYKGNGWTLIKREEFELNAPDGTPAIAQLAHFEKGESNIFVLFWYQFGDLVLITADDLYYARQKYRNDDTWPPMVKMMLQISADRPEKAREQLKEFADALHGTTRNFN